MANDLKSIEAALVAAFPLENEDKWRLRRGIMAIPIDGYFLFDRPTEEVVDHIRAVVPSDVRIYAEDNVVIRQRQRWGTGYDQFYFVVTSGEYPVLEPGASFPALRPIFYRDRPIPSEDQPTEGEPEVYVHLHAIYPSVTDYHLFTIDKSRHSFTVSEVGDRALIKIYPK